MCKIDLVSGFHPIRIHDEEVEKTAFNTQFGAFEWVVMPFGLCNAPSTFQRILNDVLPDHLGIFVWVYIDDILVFSKMRMSTNDISIWYMNYCVNTSYFPASINPHSSRAEYPSADTSSIETDYTWTPKSSRSFEVGLCPPRFMKFDNLSRCVDFTSSFEAVPRTHHPWPGGPEAYGPGARRPANPPVSGKSLYLLGVIQNPIPSHKSM